MDFLTHLFFPLLIIYVLRPQWFKSPLFFGLGGFALFSDFDKFLGDPGLLHSLVTLVPILTIGLLIEWYLSARVTVGRIVGPLVLSHLVLDFIDGGPVPLLYPFVTEGIGLQYPAQTVFGTGLLGLTVRGPLIVLRVTEPRGGFNMYGFITGFGVLSMVAFVTVVVTWTRTGDSLSGGWR